jgi:hypothetical protein
MGDAAHRTCCTPHRCTPFSAVHTWRRTFPWPHALVTDYTFTFERSPVEGTSVARRAIGWAHFVAFSNQKETKLIESAFCVRYGVRGSECSLFDLFRLPGSRFVRVPLTVTHHQYSIIIVVFMTVYRLPYLIK